MHPTRQAAVFAPALTPFNPDHSVNHQAFIAFCRWLVSQGAGLAVFGTNSEANSLALTEKIEMLEALKTAGIDPSLMLPGVGLCSLPETIELTRKAVDMDCGGVLTLPPFYFKPASDDGLFAYYSKIIQAIGSAELKLYLYHIPQFTGVPITHGLIERLMKAYPETVVGIKDSSGDWANTESMLREFPGFKVFPASEALLEKALPLGAAGCISATANIQPHTIVAAIKSWGTADFEALQSSAKAVRAIFQALPMIPALKYAVSEQTRESLWRNVRPPLMAADDRWGQKLMSDLAASGFSMPAA
jgi:4-hydroxy-tetrahydrodipicolinate synthase